MNLIITKEDTFKNILRDEEFITSNNTCVKDFLNIKLILNYII